MPLVPADLEFSRTSAELREFIECIHLKVQTDRSEFEAGMTKQGLYKQFLDEIQPLCDFTLIAYPVDYKVLPVLGNQGYDAIVFNEQGTEVDRIEITKPYDGAQSASSARQVAARGFSDMQICDPKDVMQNLLPYFEATSTAKSQKDYSGVTLVFALAVPPPLRGVEASFEQQIERIRSILVTQSFKAKRVLLFIPPSRLERIDG